MRDGRRVDNIGLGVETVRSCSPHIERGCVRSPITACVSATSPLDPCYVGAAAIVARAKATKNGLTPGEKEPCLAYWNMEASISKSRLKAKAIGYFDDGDLSSLPRASTPPPSVPFSAGPGAGTNPNQEVNGPPTPRPNFDNNSFRRSGTIACPTTSQRPVTCRTLREVFFFFSPQYSREFPNREAFFFALKNNKV